MISLILDWLPENVDVMCLERNGETGCGYLVMWRVDKLSQCTSNYPGKLSQCTSNYPGKLLHVVVVGFKKLFKLSDLKLDSK